MLDLSGWLRSQNMMWRDAHHTDHIGGSLHDRTSPPESLSSLGQHGGGRERRGFQLQRNLGAELSSVAVAGPGPGAAATATAEDEARDATPPVTAVVFLQTLGTLKVALTPLNPRLCPA